MPHDRFNLHNGSGLIEDEEGIELPDADAALAEAIKAIRSILAEDMRTGVVDLHGRIEVLDEAGILRLTIKFGDAVTIRGAEDELGGAAVFPALDNPH